MQAGMVTANEVPIKRNVAKKRKRKGKRKSGWRLWLAYFLRIATMCTIVLLLVAIWKMLVFIAGIQTKNTGLFRDKDNITIWLDAGHGGEDVGSDVGSVYEKEINLSIVEKLKKRLEEKGYKTYLTREDDSTVNKYDRAEMANKEKADLFVSIHCNSAKQDHVKGIETYFPKGDKQGEKLAEKIQDIMVNELQANDRGIQTGNFVVLNKTDMPAVLIETGFLSNKEEYRNVTDEEYQERMAKAIAEGIEEFIESENASE